MPFKRQALVEFSAVESADRCVSSGAKVPVYIAGLIGFILKKKCKSILIQVTSQKKSVVMTWILRSTTQYIVEWW